MENRASLFGGTHLLCEARPALTSNSTQGALGTLVILLAVESAGEHA